MGKEYERLFGALSENSVPAYLCERVLGAIYRERVRILRTRLVFSSCAALASFAGVLISGKVLLAALASSGFVSYASLLVSDSGSVMTSGSPFFYTLLESLPTPEVMLVLFVVAALIQSLRVMLSAGIEWSRIRPSLA